MISRVELKASGARCRPTGLTCTPLELSRPGVCRREEPPTVGCRERDSSCQVSAWRNSITQNITKNEFKFLLFSIFGRKICQISICFHTSLPLTFSKQFKDILMLTQVHLRRIRRPSWAKRQTTVCQISGPLM